MFFSGDQKRAFFSEKMRLYLIPTLPDAKVLLKDTPYDLTKGQITFRQK